MEIVDLDALIPFLDGFGPVARILLSCTGTLQTALSAYFQTPVRVRLIYQTEDGIIMKRQTELVAGDRVVATAGTVIYCIDPSIKEDLKKGQLGLGQILVKHGVQTQFKLTDVGQDEGRFWRTYKLTAPGMSYRITERFEKALYG